MVGRWQSQSSLPRPAVRGRMVQERRERVRAHTTGRMETREEGKLATGMWGLVARSTTGREGEAMWVGKSGRCEEIKLNSQARHMVGLVGHCWVSYMVERGKQGAVRAFELEGRGSMHVSKAE